MRAHKAAALMTPSAGRLTPNAPIATSPKFRTVFARNVDNTKGAKSLRLQRNKVLQIICERDNLSEWSPLQ
jgi:hypothetical protein